MDVFSVEIFEQTSAQSFKGGIVLAARAIRPTSPNSPQFPELPGPYIPTQAKKPLGQDVPVVSD
jgi:hypothetical protein